MRIATGVVVGALLLAGCTSSSGKASDTSSTTENGSTATPTTTRIAAPNSPVAVPTVAGPVTGGEPDVPVNAMPTEFATQYGYAEKEYYFSGKATAYEADGEWGKDGKWSVKPTTTAAYKSRMVVRTPTDPKKFNGTVVVEWFNETAGRDADPDFGFAHAELDARRLRLRRRLGAGARHHGPGRFHDSHPGLPPRLAEDSEPRPVLDALASRRRLLVRHLLPGRSGDLAPEGCEPLGFVAPVAARRDGRIAVGGAHGHLRQRDLARLQPVRRFRHSQPRQRRCGDQRGVEGREPGGRAHTDRHLEPGDDHADGNRSVRARLLSRGQPDTNFLRTWEMAGTAHADQSTLDYGVASGAVWSPGEKAPDFTKLCGRLNNGPETYLMSAAFAAMNAWVTDGTKPPTGPPFEVKNGTSIARAADGNAVGGIRTPAVDVPISVLDGTLAPGRSVICSLFGSVTPFDGAKLKQLYPTHDDYVGKVTASAADAVKKGFLLPADEKAIVAEAQAAAIPS